jgi:mono/diheme cytochrome c family protein
VPQAAIQTIFTGVHTTGLGTFSILARALYLSLILSGTILVFAFVGPYLNPRGFSFRTALIFLMFGLIVTGVSEWTRELLRKPYVIYNYMYSNSLLRDQIAVVNRQGYFHSAAWAIASLPLHPTIQDQGRAMFQNQCMSCHTVHGYRGMDRFLDGRDRNGIQNFLNSLRETDPKKNPYSGIMPPLVGHDDEIMALAAYLETINSPSQHQSPTATASATH